MGKSDTKTTKTQIQFICT